MWQPLQSGGWGAGHVGFIIEASHSYLLIDSNYFNGNDEVSAVAIWTTNYTNTIQNIKVINNIMYGNGYMAVRVSKSGTYSNFQVINNTIDDTDASPYDGQGVAIRTDAANGITNLLVHNNIIMQSMHLFSQDNKLYVGTGNRTLGAEIWRSTTPVHIVDFPDETRMIRCLLVGITIFLIRHLVLICGVSGRLPLRYTRSGR